MKTSKLFLFFGVLISGCGGGGGDSGASYKTPTINEATVLPNLRKVNLDSVGNFYALDSRNDGHLHGKIKHWKHSPVDDVLVPVKIDAVPNVAEALERIEKKLGYAVFDREAIEGLSDDEIDYGLIFREGTALGPEGEPDPNNCGHVGAKDGSIRYERDWQGTDGTPKVALSVNIGNGLSNSKCKPTVGLVIHEVMHALGMQGHFEGFGWGRNLNHENDMAYTVLYNIYHHEPGTPEEELDLQFPY